MIKELHHTDEPCSDKASAYRVATRHAHELCWVRGLGFLAWDGKRWARDPERAYSIAALAGAYAREQAQGIYTMAVQAGGAEGDKLKKEGDALWKWGRSCENDPRIRGTLNHLKDMLGRDISTINAHPMKLNVANGVLDFETGELLDHDPELYLTALCPVEYHAEATCPMWKAHLSWMFGGNAEMIDYVQRVAGSALTARADRLLHFFYGRGGNGKNILFDTLRQMLGKDYALQAPSDLLLSSRGDRHPAEMATLYGKRLAVLSEVESGREFHLQRLKSLTGDRTIEARFMRQDFFEFDRTWTLIMLANHKPKIRDTTDATWDRMHLIPCKSRITKAQKIVDYDLTLVAQEASGILAWAVEGCRAWQERGLGDLPEIADAVEEYRRESDSLQQFLEDACIQDPGVRAPAFELWRAYARYCEDRGLDKILRGDFPAELKNKGIERLPRTKTGYFYSGVTLEADPQEEPVQ